MSMKLFVGNVNWDAPVEEIKAYLGQYGEIEDFFYPQDRETGRPRGFCFVTYTNEEDARKALEALDGAEFSGRPLKANIAVPKEDLDGGKGGPRGPRAGGPGGDRPRRSFDGPRGDGPRGGPGGGFSRGPSSGGYGNRERSGGYGDRERSGGDRGGFGGGDRGGFGGGDRGGFAPRRSDAPRGDAPPRSFGDRDRAAPPSSSDERPRPSRFNRPQGEDDGVRIRVPRRRYDDAE